MKLTDKQKLSILKSLKLNEDFFDDVDGNDIIDVPVDNLIDEPEYTYHIQFIILKTSINLSKRKNVHSITKLFYSFCRLQNIYYNLIITKVPNTNLTSQSNVNIGIRVYKNNSYNKSVFYELMPTDMPLYSDGIELINLSNDKDETD